jgi:hypothetical protein
MNWRSGLFRIWIVTSALWIGAVGWYWYDRVYIPHEMAVQKGEQEDACIKSRQENRKLGDPYDCISGGVLQFDDLTQTSSLSLPSLGLAALMPLGSLAIWFIGNWVAAGFHRPQKRP